MEASRLEEKTLDTYEDVADKDMLKHEILISYDNKLIFYGKRKSGLVYAYQCENSREDFVQVIELIKDYSESSPVYCRYWGQINEVVVPERYGYYRFNDFTAANFSMYLFMKIEYAIKEAKNRAKLLDTGGVLKQALKTWTALQPEGFKPYFDEESHKNTDRRERSDEDTALAVLKDWDFLFLAEDEEIRRLYAEYIDKTVKFYNCCQSHDR